jgi:hypothetical protein
MSLHPHRPGLGAFDPKTIGPVPLDCDDSFGTAPAGSFPGAQAKTRAVKKDAGIVVKQGVIALDPWFAGAARAE